MKGYNRLRSQILTILNSELSANLYYHGFHHVKDVFKVCNDYIKREKIKPYQAKLLRLGALLHDIGFIESNIDHEARGVLISKKLLHEHGLSQADFNIIKGLILATKIPQSPQNQLEKIICDADLDYLGRSDFYEISNHLFKELNTYSSMTLDQWNRAQIKFLESHKYHTAFAIRNRQPNKEKRLAELKKLVKNK